MILENNRLLIEIGTGRGARIEKFFDKTKEKEWVWKPEEAQNDPYGELPLNANFDMNWAGGWEEIFPNDAPTKVNSYSLSDHGEVWSKNWIIKEGPGSHHASYVVTCDSLPVSLSKRYELDANEPRLSITYEIESLSAEELPFIFKFHPAIRIEEGDQFDVPPSVIEPVALEFSRLINERCSNDEKKKLIRTVLPRDNFSREFVKLSDMKEGFVSLKNKRTDSELQFSFDRKEFPYVWLFQSYGGFLGHYVAMIEPTNAAHYDLAVSSKEKTASILNPFEKRMLRLEIMLK